MRLIVWHKLVMKLLFIIIISAKTSILFAQQTNNLISYKDIKTNSSIGISILHPNSFEIYKDSPTVSNLLGFYNINQPTRYVIQDWKMGDYKKIRENIFGEVIRTILIETMR